MNHKQTIILLILLVVIPWTHAYASDCQLVLELKHESKYQLENFKMEFCPGENGYSYLILTQGVNQKRVYHFKESFDKNVQAIPKKLAEIRSKHSKIKKPSALKSDETWSYFFKWGSFKEAQTDSSDSTKEEYKYLLFTFMFFMDEKIPY